MNRATWWKRRRRVPFVAQSELAECGACCLAMVLAYHGAHIAMPEMRAACAVSRNGSSALDLVNAARGHGLQAQGHRVDQVQALSQLPLPAILHWDFSHYVVLERFGPRGAAIVDPRFGRVPVTHAFIGMHFTGIALSFVPGEGFRTCRRVRPSLRHYTATLRRYIPNLLQILAATMLMQLMALIFPASTRVLVDHVLVTGQSQWLWALGIGLGMVATANIAMVLIRGWVLQSLQILLDRALVGSMLSHLLRLPVDFFLQREPGDLVQRVQANTMIRSIISDQTLAAVLDASLVLAYTALMLAFDGTLGLLMAVIGIVQFTLIAIARRHMQRLMWRELNATGNEEASVVSALSGLETTRALGAETRLVSQWQRAAGTATNRRMERQGLEIGLRQLLTVIKGIATVVVLWVGGKAALRGEMTLGAFAAFMTLVGLFLAPLESLANALMELQLLGAQLRRMDDVFGVQPETSGSIMPTRLHGSIAFHGVSYRYAPGTPCSVRDITLTIAPGEKIAIVGRSGSGKSTLARLLAGMHLPDSGSITLDGVALHDYDLTALRRCMGTVLQEQFLFDVSIMENLLLPLPGGTFEQVRDAARLACIEQFIESLPDGFDSRVGENGSHLSGGQRQRICLARALIGSPAVLVLDEATSALDAATEAEVHGNLRALACTQVIIAHRLDTVRDADRIVVMEDGCIVEQGSFAQLADAQGPFSRLVQAGSHVNA